MGCSGRNEDRIDGQTSARVELIVGGTERQKRQRRQTAGEETAALQSLRDRLEKTRLLEVELLHKEIWGFFAGVSRLRSQNLFRRKGLRTRRREGPGKKNETFLSLRKKKKKRAEVSNSGKALNKTPRFRLQARVLRTRVKAYTSAGVSACLGLNPPSVCV